MPVIEADAAGKTLSTIEVNEAIAMERTLYLKDNVMMEPLFNGWYVWPLLIQPITASMIVTNLHMRIMDSYLKAPELHAAAAKNPAMRGGPFMDYEGPLQVVHDLIADTRRRMSFASEIADAVKALDEMLQSEAQGSSLEELYPRVPDVLKGYVELGYDLHHNPSFRMLEGVVYRSKYYREELQGMSLSLLEGDHRPFVLSTPRLSTDDNIMVDLPYRSRDIDRLFAMRDHGDTEAFVRQFAESYIADPAKREMFHGYFTDTAPVRNADRNFNGPGVRIRYFGHATVLVESADVTIMTDPVISYALDGGVRRFSYADLPDRIDYVLLTHAHQDHVMFETLLQIRHRIGTIVVPKNGGGTLQDPSLKLMLKTVGFENVLEIDELESVPVTGGEIVGLPFFGEHGDLHIRSKQAFYVNLEGSSMLFAADSNNLEPRLYEHLRDIVGNIQHIFIGMECEGAPMSWLYGPLFTRKVDRKLDQARRLNGSNYERALDIVQSFSPESVYIYAMGKEPWLTYISSISYTEDSLPIVESNKLLAACAERAIQHERLFGEKTIQLA